MNTITETPSKQADLQNQKQSGREENPPKCLSAEKAVGFQRLVSILIWFEDGRQSKPDFV